MEHKSIIGNLARRFAEFVCQPTLHSSTSRTAEGRLVRRPGSLLVRLAPAYLVVDALVGGGVGVPVGELILSSGGFISFTFLSFILSLISLPCLPHRFIPLGKIENKAVSDVQSSVQLTKKNAKFQGSLLHRVHDKIYPSRQDCCTWSTWMCPMNFLARTSS